MTAKTPAQVKALYQSGQNIFRRQSVECLLDRIEELEAEAASEERWANYYQRDTETLRACIEELGTERDQFAAMLGAEHAKQTSPPKGGDA